uniref:LD-carboxypeptidase n=1 Tax=Roseihalotalea indica TaxID=2867963 RepID=A0AA49GU18_9BACT|nr:LD-carboxypeptidase [Tunicatimonas sp. TK19036]
MHRRQFFRNATAASLTGLMLPSLKTSSPSATVKPARLKEGDTIGLITPSHYITEENLRESVENLAKLGFRVKYSENMLVRKGYLGGTDLQRADDINRMFADENVAGIMCARGGYGTTRMLPYLDYDVIRNNPKVLIGYSDITGLLYALYGQTGLVCFHGPMGTSDYNDYTTKYFKEVVMEPQNKLMYQNPELISEDELVPLYLQEEDTNISQAELITLSPGTAEGTLVGGNLSLVAAMCGTPYDVDMRDKIVFLEDVGEAPYRIDRMLTQLLLDPNKLPAAKGVVLGLFADCEADDEEKSFSLAHVLYDRLTSLGIPVLYGLMFGHIKRNATIPFGVRARLDATAKTLTLSEKAVT